MEMSEMTARRPYLLRAFYDWLLDNDLTPHLVVDINLPGVMVPLEYARDGQIVLNIAPRAVGNLELTNEEVHFNARFGGVPRQVVVPMVAVMAIYARENGAGTMFEPEPAYEQLAGDNETQQAPSETMMSVIDGDLPDDAETSGSDDDNDPPPRGGGRPALRIVK
ncbi:ClpXP protease specificity-enhancing factor [Tatumella citrea]|uniref:Stringent starvation protein B n=1 Tax=Tatumella citrea TaxID=53336 RepID=A0A1Y0LFI2_TATCI|nr:ClpXP protease specificity-enhancing factor [Tatumella citrea]ARU92500.1 ClpXP protease specificity-enhancing factor [Tatumella citrea]ARU96535.1 ClpXP protease specificity-enhancing factor [Tatumella citrea]